MAWLRILQHGWLLPGLAATACLCALLAGAGVQPEALSAVAALASGAAVVAGLQSRRERIAQLEQLADTQLRHSHDLRLQQDENEGLQRELERLDQLKAELVTAKQTAEAAVLAKGEFLATMSHEIRTPLNGIVPMLDLMARGPLAPAQQQMLLTATASSRQLLRIVDDILDYSKLEANKLELESTAMNLRSVLEELVGLLKSSAEQKGLSLRLEIDASVRPSVRGDVVRLRQILGNLVSNAIKFTERGHICIRVQAIGETLSQHLLRFEVIDTGIGIDADKQHHLFNPFSQADASTTRLYGGTGLGLAICRRIVDLMEGRIGVRSHLGQGSTFWFEAPLLKSIGDMPFQMMESKPLPALLVCADSTLSDRLLRLGSRWSLHFHHVCNAHEALDYMRQAGDRQLQRPELVVADAPSLRQTVHALHRAVINSTHQPRLVWLTDPQLPLPASLLEGARGISRLAGDGELRHTVAPLVMLPFAGTGNPPPPPDRSFAPETSDSAAAAADPIPDIKGMSVLLAEDNPVNRLVAQQLLESLGVSVFIAENGQQALDFLENAQVHAVLMDCQMPVLDGYQATRRWRDQEVNRRQQHMPIIAMTANAMGGDRQRCLDAGMDDYLSKPVSINELRNALAHWFDNPSARLHPRPLSSARDGDTPRPQVAAAPGSAITCEENGASTAIASTTSTLPLDLSVLDELYQLIGEKTTDIVSAYLMDTPEVLREMQQAATALDLAALGEAAHSLKSASANVGATGLAAIAQRIETGVRRGELENPSSHAGLLVAEFARTRIGLRAWQTHMSHAKEPAI